MTKGFQDRLKNLILLLLFFCYPLTKKRVVKCLTPMSVCGIVVPNGQTDFYAVFCLKAIFLVVILVKSLPKWYKFFSSLNVNNYCRGGF